ncbi:hypothetical protein CcaCcLH18_10922 [Colletotrichum camelliae]|nr:hypothetical protein CcaCcLH18_10922 [Colletotrichum camelliae]
MHTVTEADLAIAAQAAAIVGYRIKYSYIHIARMEPTKERREAMESISAKSMPTAEEVRQWIDTLKMFGACEGYLKTFEGKLEKYSKERT